MAPAPAARARRRRGRGLPGAAGADRVGLPGDSRMARQLGAAGRAVGARRRRSDRDGGDARHDRRPAAAGQPRLRRLRFGRDRRRHAGSGLGLRAVSLPGIVLRLERRRRRARALPGVLPRRPAAAVGGGAHAGPALSGGDRRRRAGGRADHAPHRRGRRRPPAVRGVRDATGRRALSGGGPPRVRRSVPRAAAAGGRFHGQPGLGPRGLFHRDRRAGDADCQPRRGHGRRGRGRQRHLGDRPAGAARRQPAAAAAVRRVAAGAARSAQSGDSPVDHPRQRRSQRRRPADVERARGSRCGSSSARRWRCWPAWR